MNPDISAEDYQDQTLPHVSRTFALTIPQLPPALRSPVTNAYLLCRIADTIEDEPAVSPPETIALMQRFKDAVAGRADPVALVRDLAPLLSDSTLPAERDLVLNMERVIRLTAGFEPGQRRAIIRCVELMCYGMPHFQFNASLAGLARSTDLDDYCYYVAGVVGEMLTELFCCHSPKIAARRAEMEALAESFAQGLQMTNILKDLWEDRSRGVCWFPQSVFSRHGIDLAQLQPEPHDPRFPAALRELIGVAHAHLRNALEYTLLIPPEEAGIRRFLLWAVGLAILTLRKIDANPRYTAGSQVKVTRSAVAMTRILTDVALRRNALLRGLFALAARGVPLAQLGPLRRHTATAGKDLRPSVPHAQAPEVPAERTGTYGSARR
jgi:farnesyl-diphosphate farnesyltransferase